MTSVKETSDAASDMTETVTHRTLRHLIIVVAFVVFACAWIGQQVVFPLVPAIGRVVRQLPSSVQTFCILTLLAFSIVGACYFFYEWARERFRPQPTIKPYPYGVEDPRFNENTTN